MTVYLILAIVGVVGLLLSLIIDDVIDGIFGGAPDWLTGVTIFSFLAIVGLVGLLARGFTDEPVTTIIALAAGVGAAVAVHFITRSLMSSEPAMNAGDLVGVKGTSIMGAPAGLAGEVMLTVGGHRIKVNARCDTDLRPGQVVTVTHAASATSVTVTAADTAPSQ